jgi:WD40 repeat protein
MGVLYPNFNLKRDSAKLKNFGCTFAIRNAHSERINCLCYLNNGIFASGSNDKFIRVWNSLDPKPIGSLEEDNVVTLMLRLGKT